MFSIVLVPTDYSYSTIEWVSDRNELINVLLATSKNRFLGDVWVFEGHLTLSELPDYIFHEE